jgi:hypothetical protein
MKLGCRWRSNTFIYNVNKIPIHVYTTRVLYREIYNLFMQALITGKKGGPWRCFFSCLAASFISTDTVHILFLSCQSNCKIVWKSKSNRHYNRCQSCPQPRQCLHCYRFLPSLNMNQELENIFVDQWPYTTPNTQSMHFHCSY